MKSLSLHYYYYCQELPWSVIDNFIFPSKTGSVYIVMIILAIILKWRVCFALTEMKNNFQMILPKDIQYGITHGVVYFEMASQWVY
jgi:hypothetical protein